MARWAERRDIYKRKLTLIVTLLPPNMPTRGCCGDKTRSNSLANKYEFFRNILRVIIKPRTSTNEMVGGQVERIDATMEFISALELKDIFRPSCASEEIYKSREFSL